VTAFGSIEAVIAAVREDVHEETARIEREAAAAIERLRQEDAAMPVVIPDADARLASARVRGRERLAAEDWEDRQRALQAREAWISSVVQAATRRLFAEDAVQKRAHLVALAREALGRLTGADCTILLAADDAPLVTEAVRRELESATGKRVRVEPSDAVPGGCIAQTSDGRVRCDNTYAARIRRYEPAWRRIVTDRFERLVPIHA
jgi:vacuolar-type H+-ATPase subunit E/Vma4